MPRVFCQQGLDLPLLLRQHMGGRIKHLVQQQQGQAH